MPVLKLEKNDPQAELEFQVKCSLKFTQAERIHQMLELTKAMLQLAGQYADRKPPQVIKRTARS